MLAITRENNGCDGLPSAEKVAERADVGLRTVFRHFNDMDSLYREMSSEIEVELRAVIEQPLLAADWRDRLLEMVSRRALAFERIAPFRRAADTVRHRSPLLTADNMRFAHGLRGLLLAELPKEIADDPLKLEVLDLLLSWEAWSRLRREQGLSADQAECVLKEAVRNIIT